MAIPIAIAVVGVVACPVSAGAGCLVAFAAVAALETAAIVKIQTGSTDLAISAGLVTFASGLVGAAGSTIATTTPLQAMLLGAASGAVIGAFRGAVYGDLGYNVLEGTAKGAIFAVWGMAIKSTLSQASAAEARGETEVTRAVKGETLESVLAREGIAGRQISADEALGDADTADWFRATGKDPYTDQEGMTVAETLYVGVADGIQGGVNYGRFWGIAADDSLNFRILSGWTKGAGVGGKGFAGFQLQVSNAQTVWDLGGPFSYVSAGEGAGPYWSFDGFWGPSEHGFVSGYGVTFGAGAGGGYSAGASVTTVHGAGPEIPYYLSR